MSDRTEDALLAILKGLALAFPTFAAWLVGLIAGKDEAPAFTRRVRDILPVKSESRKVAEELRREQAK